MYTYEELLKLLNLNNNSQNKFYLKCIIKALILNNEATLEKQLLIVDINRVKYLLFILENLKEYLDYKYNTKNDLIMFLYFMINNQEINFNAIFCPGYTDNGGYKNRIGQNNTDRIIRLHYFKDLLNKLKLKTNMHIILADIFLENTDSDLNPFWEKELLEHKKLFIQLASKYFANSDISFLSNDFSSPKYIKGFVNPNLIKDKNYVNFLKNNRDFYEKMGWDEEEIILRNDRLYTIYTIRASYINKQTNGIYMPMESMYSRSKVMTSNGTCTMYLYKK